MPPSDPRRWDPFRDLEREMGRLIHTLQGPRSWRVRAYPPMNIYEVPGAYLLTVEVPGVDASTFDISLSDETVTVQGERRPGEPVGEERYRRRERPFGRWSRVVNLPGRVDAEKVAAHYAEGILTVTLPRAEESLPRQIAVTASP